MVTKLVLAWLTNSTNITYVDYACLNNHRHNDTKQRGNYTLFHWYMMTEVNKNYTNLEINTSSVYKTLLNMPRADYVNLVTETVEAQKICREAPTMKHFHTHNQVTWVVSSARCSLCWFIVTMMHNMLWPCLHYDMRDIWQYFVDILSFQKQLSYH